MRILIYRYGSICEPDIIEAFRENGHNVSEIDIEIYNKNVTPSETIRIISKYLNDNPFDMVFSVNFYPSVSEICNIYHIPYVCWSVDCPVLELFSHSIQNKWNRIFLFDMEQYSELHPYNPECIFYLPLATNYGNSHSIIQNCSAKDHKKFTSDISFVGSLYTEKCDYDKATGLPEYLRGYLDGIMRAQLNVYGYYFIDKLIDDDIASAFKRHLPDFYIAPEKSFLSDRYIMSQLYLGHKISSMERINIMERINRRYDVDIYTGSDTSRFLRLRNHGFAKSRTEMPLIFNHGKINLNITSKPIRSGIPLRIWDILGCGGFCLTNYQNELAQYFVVGEHIDCYGSLDELDEKIDYYLTHEKERAEIAHNAEELIKSAHTYNDRISVMLKQVFMT